MIPRVCSRVPVTHLRRAERWTGDWTEACETSSAA